MWAVAATAAAATAPPSATSSNANYDIVIANVRAIDPETGLDAIRNIGIQGHSIGDVSPSPLKGRRLIDGKGVVAAPGFIDPHPNAYGDETSAYQAMDGVTTRLELEIGFFPVKRWYAKKHDHELINYGASVNHLR